MILNWLENDTLRKDEQLMNVLYDCGMATFQQLLVITGWSERNLRYHMTTLNNRNKKSASAGEVSDKSWLQAHYPARPLSGKAREAVYTLGRNAIRHVHEIRRDNQNISEPKLGQLVHFVKTNDILVRVLKRFGRTIRWHSSYEATDLLILRWNQKVRQDDKKLNRRTAIRPDGKLYVGESAYFIEFDNSTEGPRQLERKFHSYANILPVIGDPSPVLWVTREEKRKEYLAKNWEAVKMLSYQEEKVPDMYFFVEGEETDFLARIHQKSVPPTLLR